MKWLRERLMTLEGATDDWRQTVSGLSGLPLGILCALIVPIAGSLWPTMHDRLLLPAVHGCLPWLSLVAVAACVLAAWRPGACFLLQWSVCFALGIAFGLFVVLDWWYLAPLTIVLIVAVALWRVHWCTWYRPGLTAATCLVIGIALLTSMRLDFDSALPLFDPRFGFGQRGLLETIAVGGVLLLICLLVGRWAFRVVLRGHEINRQTIEALIMRNPRCDLYFDTFARLTRTDERAPELWPGGSAPKRRLSSSEEPPGQLNERLLPGPELPAMGRVQRIVSVLQRPLSFAQRQSDLRWLLRLCRSGTRGAGHPSRWFIDILNESRMRRLRKYEQLTHPCPSSSELARFVTDEQTDDRQNRHQSADGYFLDFATLTEARIEASHYVFLEPEVLKPEAAAEEIGKLRSSLEPLANRRAGIVFRRIGSSRPLGAGDPNRPPSPEWRDVARQYELLWVMNLERLWSQHGTRVLTDVARRSDPISFSRLTCNLISARRMHTPEISAHRGMAELALLEAVRACEDPKGTNDDALLLEYFQSVREKLDRNKNAFSAEERADMRWAACGHALWRLAQGWHSEAGRSFVTLGELLESDDPANEDGLLAARVIDAIVHTFHALQELKKGQGAALAQVGSGNPLWDDDLGEDLLLLNAARLYSGFAQVPPPDADPIPEEQQGVFRRLSRTSAMLSLLAWRHWKERREDSKDTKASEHQGETDSEDGARGILEPGAQVIEKFPPSELRRARDPGPEEPRHPIRLRLAAAAVLAAAGMLLMALFFGNPVGAIRDLRRATSVYDTPLTSVEAVSYANRVWLGTEKNGIEVYRESTALFGQPITEESTGGKLLSNHIADLSIGIVRDPAAAVVTEGDLGVRALVVGDTADPPRFWDDPVIDLSSFPGLEDDLASCIAATGDGNRILVGTRGLGLAVYDVVGHSWTRVLTTEDGLPSNLVHDLELAGTASNANTIWMATDKGICYGTVADDGAFELGATYDVRHRLAGPSVVRLASRDNQLWYLTEGGGQGRFSVTPMGLPVAAGAHELLVTERRLPGLNDAAFHSALSSPGGRSTWFLAEIERRIFLGRYSEQPHDTHGIPLEADLDLASIGRMSADRRDGRAVLIGTESGSWFFRESDSAPGLIEIEGGWVGPAGMSALEVALPGRTAIVKGGTGIGPTGIMGAEANWTGGPFAWEEYVGTGRFPLLNEDDLTSAVSHPVHGVLFGTRDKGIGRWDPSRLEMTRALHEAGDASARLRDNRTLDLTATATHVFQVTGDLALDAFQPGPVADTGFPERWSRNSLVPPSAAALAPDDIRNATARGRFFAIAGRRGISVYDARTLSWSELPLAAGARRLEATPTMLFAHTYGNELIARALPVDLDEEWAHLSDDVDAIAANADVVIALVRAMDVPAKILTFDGATGELAFDVAPERLAFGGPSPGWQHAATTAESLLLVGEDRAVHRYRLPTRKWDRIELPDELTPPLEATAQTTDGFWMLDADGIVHRLDLATESFDVSLALGVRELAGASDAVIVRRLDGRVSVLSDLDPETPLTVVGGRLRGEIHQLVDAVQVDEDLVVALPHVVGVYEWETHNWVNIAPLVTPVTKLLALGDQLWILGGTSADRQTLQALRSDEFEIVEFGDAPLQVRKVVAASEHLFAQGSEGELFSVSARTPLQAIQLVAGTALPGWDNTPPSSSQIALMGEAPVIADGNQVHVFEPLRIGTPPVWSSFAVPADAMEIATPPRARRIAVRGRKDAYELRIRGPGEAERPLSLLPAGESNGSVVQEIAAVPRGSYAAYQRSDERGRRVSGLLPGRTVPTTVIGAALSRASPSRAVVRGGTALLRLDAAGAISHYDINTRSWSEIAAPDDFEELFKIASGGREEVLAFDRQRQRLWAWDGMRDLRADARTRDLQVQRVTPLPTGLLLWLESGGVSWRAVQTEAVVLRPAPPPQVAQPQLDALVDAVEVDRMLVLLDDRQRVAVFDQRDHTWRSSPVRRVGAVLKRGRGNEVFLFDVGEGQLRGPIARADAHNLSAPAIAGAAGLAEALVLGNEIVALGEDGTLYLLRGDEWEAWRGYREDTSPLAEYPTIAARGRNGNDLVLVLQPAEVSNDSPSLVVRIDQSTLMSRISEGPRGRVRSLSSERSPLIVEITDESDGRWLHDFATNSQLLSPTPDVLQFAGMEGVFVALTRNREIKRLSGNALVEEFVPTVIPGESPLAGVASLDTDLLVWCEDGTLYIREAGGRWEAVRTSPGGQHHVWLDGDTLYDLTVAASSVARVREFVPASRSWSEVPNSFSGIRAWGEHAESLWTVTAPRENGERDLSLGEGSDPQFGTLPLVLNGGEIRMRSVRAVHAVDENSLVLDFEQPAGRRVFRIEADGLLVEVIGTFREDTMSALENLPEPDVEEDALLTEIRSRLDIGENAELSCMVGNRALAVANDTLNILDATDEPVRPAMMVAFGDGDISAVAGQDDHLLVRRGDALWRFSTHEGAELLISESVVDLFAKDGRLFALVGDTNPDLVQLSDDGRLDSSARTNFDGQLLGRAFTTGTPEHGGWRVPTSMDGSYVDPNGQQWTFSTGFRTFLEDRIERLEEFGDVIRCQTQGRPRLFGMTGGSLVEQSEILLQQLEPRADPTGAGAWGGFAIVPDGEGRWRDGIGDGDPVKLTWTRPDGTQIEVIPSRRFRSLAHEVITDIALESPQLHVDTEGGILTFGATDQAPGLTADRTALARPRAEAEALRRALRVSAGHLRNWRFAVGAGNQIELEFRFGHETGAANWERVTLTAQGFLHERAVAAHADGGQFDLFTRGGRLRFAMAALAGALPEPTSLDPGAALRAVPPGTLRVVAEDRGNRIFSDNPSSAQLLQVFDGAVFRPPVDAERNAARDAVAILLADAEWTWERPGSQTIEAVAWTRAGVSVDSGFDRAAGRFGWDYCVNLGQAGGEAWINTYEGLFRVRDGVIQMSSLETGSWIESVFRPVSGGTAGALLDGQTPVSVTDADGEWGQPAAASSPLRAASGQWRVYQNGRMERIRPSDPRAWDEVRIASDGRWDFESIQDVAPLGRGFVVATRFGLQHGSPGVVGFERWQRFERGATRVGHVNERMVARLANNSGVELDEENRWISSTLARRLDEPTPYMIDGDRWRVHRTKNIDVLRQPAAVHEPVATAQGRFAFDRVSSVHLVHNGRSVLATEEGVVERPRGGDVYVQDIPGVGPQSRPTFFRVPSTPPGRNPVHADLAGGLVQRTATVWAEVLGNEARGVREEHRGLAAVSDRWRATRSAPNAELDVALRLPADRPELYRSLIFDPARGLFLIDVFECVAPGTVPGTAFVGSRQGLQRLRGPQLARLWCEERDDGLGSVVVEEAALDATGDLQFRVRPRGTHVLAGEKVQPSDTASLQAAIALRTLEPRGWRLDVKERNGEIDVEVLWRGQPTWLVRSPRGGTRFAHNIVHAARAVGGSLWLGTDAGLVRLHAPPTLNLEDFDLVSTDFGAPPTARITWLADDLTRGVLLARTGAGERPWTVDPTSMVVSRSELDMDAASIVHRGRVMVWRQPRQGVLDLRFADGRVVPATTLPEVADGTFTFVDLTQPRSRPSYTIADTAVGFFWSSRAGIVEYDPDPDPSRRGLVVLHAATADGNTSLEEAFEVRWSEDAEKLYARAGTRRSAVFVPAERKWAPTSLGSQGELGGRIVARSDTLEWLREAPLSVRPRYRSTDRVAAPVFVGGKPTVDTVHDFAFFATDDQTRIALGTDAGVAQYTVSDFRYRRLEAQQFVVGPEVEPVVEVASSVLPEQGPRTCCRTESGRSFELEPEGWVGAGDVDEVFDASYRKIQVDGVWSWARYPNGLVCTVHDTNGPPLRLGAAVDDTLAPIFTHHRMSFDDVRNAIVVEDTVLMTTPIGIQRLALDRTAETATREGLDCWGLRDERLEGLRDLNGIVRHNAGLAVWQHGTVFGIGDPASREWLATESIPSEFTAQRILTRGSDVWLARADEDRIAVSLIQGEAARGTWYARDLPEQLTDCAVSDSGLWFVAGNRLFLADRARAQRSPGF